jgi:hypothetical protein
VEKQCIQCRTSFTKPLTCSLTDWAARKFCSRLCFKTRLTKNCASCCKPYIRFCSAACRQRISPSHVRSSNEDKTCITCGKVFWVKGVKRRAQQKVCSQACRKGYMSPRWKGGKTPANHLLRHSKEYNEWRKAVYQRDYWTCQKCNIKQKHPVAHHIKNFRIYVPLRYDVNNGMTLCRACHKSTHKEIGRKTQFQKTI